MYFAQEKDQQKSNQTLKLATAKNMINLDSVYIFLQEKFTNKCTNEM